MKRDGRYNAAARVACAPCAALSLIGPRCSLRPWPISPPSIVHIDFGWMLAKVMPMNIEASAPFKLTADMAAVMRCGSNSPGFQVTRTDMPLG